MQIQKAALKDVEAISRIYALSWKKAYIGMIPQKYLDELQETFWVEVLQNWIKNFVFSVELLYKKDEIIGCITYGKSREEQLSNWGEIPSIYLLPQYWGKGYGELLLKKALSDLKEKGYPSVFLWVLKENERARYFYEKNGFYWNKEKLNFEIMGKTLTDYRYIYYF